MRGSGAPGRPVPTVEDIGLQDTDATTVVSIADHRVVLLRRLDHSIAPEAECTLNGTWPGSPSPALLALLL